MNQSLNQQVLDLSPNDGTPIFFKVIPNRDRMMDYIYRNSSEFGCENPNPDWIKEKTDEVFSDVEPYYFATVIPNDQSETYDLWETFGKFIEKVVEEQTGWISTIRTYKDNPSISGENLAVLNYDEDYVDWESLYLGMINL